MTSRCSWLRPSLNPRRPGRRWQWSFESPDVLPLLPVGPGCAGPLRLGLRHRHMVVNSGDGVTCTVPIFEGLLLPHAVTQLYVAGRDITETFHPAAAGQREDLPCVLDKALVDDIKEKSCVMWPWSRRKSWAGGGGVVSTSCLMATSFQDQLYQAPCSRLSSWASRTRACPRWSPAASPNVADIQKDPLWGDCVLSGGTTLFQGLDDRLPKGAGKAGHQGDPHQDHGTTGRWFSTWIGASIVRFLSSFKQM